MNWNVCLEIELGITDPLEVMSFIKGQLDHIGPCCVTSVACEAKYIGAFPRRVGVIKNPYFEEHRDVPKIRELPDSLNGVRMDEAKHVEMPAMDIGHTPAYEIAKQQAYESLKELVALTVQTPATETEKAACARFAQIWIDTILDTFSYGACQIPTDPKR